MIEICQTDYDIDTENKNLYKIDKDNFASIPLFFTPVHTTIFEDTDIL